jgi:hypothetical protein
LKSILLSIAAAAAAPVFGVSGAHVTMDGAPVFPVLAYYQCGDTARAAASAGVDFFVQQPYIACTWQQPNDFATEALPSGVHSFADTYGPETDADAGWYLPDEPDALALTPDELPQLPPPTTTGKLRLVDFSEHFFSGQALIRPGYDRNEYAQFAARGDFVGFDLYPVVKFCGRIPLLDVFRAQHELATIYAAGKPTFQWIETGPMTGECTTLQVTPAIANAEAWLAVAGGAAGIGWFTIGWTPAGWTRWQVDGPMLAQIATTDARLHSLAAVLTAPQGPVDVAPADAVAASSRTYDGAAYVIAVNSTDRPTTATLRIPGLRASTLQVLEEGRSVRSTKKGVVRDTFAPYAVHLYRAG